MNSTKFGVLSLVVAALFAAPTAFAQSYSYSNGSCVDLSYNLSYGQKGSQVSMLQRFLVAQNYPGGGSWMITGYYGQATVQAVRNFQQTHGLSATGSVDAATRAAISNASCGFPGLGGTGYSYSYTYGQSLPYTNNYSYSYGTPYSYNYNNAYTYGYNYNYGYNGYTTCGTYPYTYLCLGGTSYGSAPVLTSLSTTYAAPGTPVTVYGTGFDSANNTVYVGGTTLSGISSNGTQLTFTMPSDLSGTVSVSIGNARGTSNALTLSTYAYGYPNGQTGYPCGYSYYGTYNCPNTSVPVVTSLSPVSGAVGTSVTVYGSGFSSTGNSIHFGNGVIANLSSFDGHSVSFVVPSTLTGYGYQPVGLGTYQVSVANQNGVLSNSMPFTITSTNTNGSTLSITNVSGPTTLATGISGTWSITISNPNSSYLSTSVNWGDSTNYASTPSTQTYTSGSTSLTFSHVYSAAGTYTVTFTINNGSGQSNTASATVTVTGNGSTGNVMISSVSPTSGHVGTQIAIYGTGFDAYNNTVHFGIGGTMHVPSYNGIIYYTVPAYVTPCDVSTSGTVCAQYAQQVTPGSYPIYITTGTGTSNTSTFQVN